MHHILSNQYDFVYKLNGFQQLIIMNLEENEYPKKGPYRERFFSSMNYEEYEMHFGPPKPLLKPVADPEIEIQELKLDDAQPKKQNNDRQDWNAMGFGRCPMIALATIKQSKASEEASNYQTQKRESSVVEATQQIDFGRERFKRSHSRMRSMSQNPNLLILSLLEKAQRITDRRQKLN